MAASEEKVKEIVKPIVYGNTAYCLAERDAEGHSHMWTVFVKPYYNEDMSSYVSKVHFKLHKSFYPQMRIITKPPYEVTETGWGEFQVIIKIFFRDPKLHYVTLRHDLILYNTPGVKYEEGRDPSKKIVSEAYDELVFRTPSRLLLSLCKAAKPLTDGPYGHHVDFEAKKAEATANIDKAQCAVTDEIALLMGKIEMTRFLSAQVKAKLEMEQYMKTKEGKNEQPLKKSKPRKKQQKKINKNSDEALYEP